jgi:hypothetical protein
VSAFFKSALVLEGISAGIAVGFDVDKRVAEEREVDHSGPIGEEFIEYVGKIPRRLAQQSQTTRMETRR